MHSNNSYLSEIIQALTSPLPSKIEFEDLEHTLEIIMLLGANISVSTGYPPEIKGEYNGRKFEVTLEKKDPFTDARAEVLKRQADRLEFIKVVFHPDRVAKLQRFLELENVKAKLPGKMVQPEQMIRFCMGTLREDTALTWDGKLILTEMRTSDYLPW